MLVAHFICADEAPMPPPPPPPENVGFYILGLSVLHLGREF